MDRLPHRSLLAILLFANAGAVLLYCGQGAVNAGLPGVEANWHPLLAIVANLLTLPIPTGSDISAVREVVLPVCLGLAMLFLAVRASRVGSVLAREVNDHTNAPASRLRNPAERWLWVTCGAALLIAILSAVANKTLGLSSGWIIRLFVGAVWAILIARYFTPMMIRRAVMGLLVIGLICLSLALAHRSNRHISLFMWPIGPITPTAAFAALWCAMGAGFIAMLLASTKGRLLTRGNMLFSVLAIGVAIVAAYVLQQSARRAPMIGLAAAAMLIFVLIIKRRLRPQRARMVVIAALALGLIGTTGYVIRQKMSTTREVSGPLGIRFEYWRLAGKLILASPSLGFGADTFFIEMTNAVAPLRDVSPHFYHGDIDNYAHNEWIQSAVEIGIPGAIFYLLIPLGVLFMVISRLAAPPPRPADITSTTDLRAISAPTVAVTAALAAGLMTILVTESAGITLRTALMPTWYWTIIGLLVAACRPPITEEEIPHRQLPRWLRVVPVLLIAAVCFTASGLDLFHAVYTAQPDVVSSSSGFRLYAEDSVMSDWRQATLLSDLARASRSQADLERAASHWHDLNALIPGFRDTPARYAEILLLDGQRQQARGIVEQVIDTGYTPHEVAANHILALLREDDAVVQFRCLQRGIRNVDLRPAVQKILRDIANKPAITEALSRELHTARRFVTEHEAIAKDEILPELLRLNAFVKMDAYLESKQREDIENFADEAIADQRLAAEYYAFLEESNNIYRRGHAAEIDAWYTLARMLYDARPAEYQQAIKAIASAERYAVLSIAHQKLPNPNPQYGYVIGEVMPTEFPERLRPLWELSALLHLVVGKDQFLDMRTYFSLPPEQWNAAAMNRKLAALARQAYEHLSKIPANQRPMHYDALPKMAERAELAARQP